MKRIFALMLALTMLLTLAACGGSGTKSVDLAQLYTEYENTLPSMLVLDETMMMNFLGIPADKCTQVVAAICADGLRADEVWLIEAKDQAALEELTKLVNTRLNAKKDETVSYNPEQYAVVEKAEILTNGLYLAFLVSPDADGMKATFEAAFQ